MRFPMKTVEQQLSIEVRRAFREAFPDVDLSRAALDVVPTSDESHGDYQCNAAMGLARDLKRAPRDIATAAMESLGAAAAIDRVEVAGPGFINLTVNTSWLAGHLQALEMDEQLGVPAVGAGKTVILDYSGPNVAKQMHIGHIRSTVIGNVLDRLHRFLGYHVLSDNHLGDWGTQFGILIVGYREFRDEEALQKHPIAELERIYVASSNRCKTDDAWLQSAREELVKLQQGDAENLKLWQLFLDLSLGEFESIYERLGVSFDMVRGESFYRDQLSDLVAAMEAKGLAVESEGALVVELEKEKLPVCMVRKSDGGFNYATSDLATIRTRLEEFKPDEIVYVTDERQQLHFRQVFAVAEGLGWKALLSHVWFGLMRFPKTFTTLEGQTVEVEKGTISTREGTVIRLHELLNEAEVRALAMVKQASPDMPEDQQRDVARAVGIGAIKYADLSQNPQSVVTFTWEKALSLEGNSAPYLQYAYARIASVLDRYTATFPASVLEDHPIILQEAVERRLALRLVRFPDAVTRACQSKRPNVLADYLFELAQVYSSFYQNVPFLKAEEGVRESRLRLCGLVAKTLKTGLNLLGINTPERI